MAVLLWSVSRTASSGKLNSTQNTPSLTKWVEFFRLSMRREKWSVSFQSCIFQTTYLSVIFRFCIFSAPMARRHFCLLYPPAETEFGRRMTDGDERSRQTIAAIDSALIVAKIGTEAEAEASIWRVERRASGVLVTAQRRRWQLNSRDDDDDFRAETNFDRERRTAITTVHTRTLRRQNAADSDHASGDSKRCSVNLICQTQLRWAELATVVLAGSVAVPCASCGMMRCIRKVTMA